MKDDKAVVYVVDDDEAAREAVADLLRSVGHTVQSFGSAQEFLDSPRPDAPGCLVLDVRLPGPSGLELQRILIKSKILFPIVFLSGHGDIPMSVRAIKSGAIDFLTKPPHEQQLLDAVQSGIEQDRNHRERAKLVANLQERFELLTSREREVLALVAAGTLNKQIAWELGLSEVTVKIHRSRVMQKMGAKSLADLVRMVESLGGETANSSTA